MDANRTALLRVVASLFSMIGLVPGGSALESLSRREHLRALRLVRPAESALRRLIVIAYHSMGLTGVTVKTRPARPFPKTKFHVFRTSPIPAFPLIDQRKRFFQRPRHSGPGPRVTLFNSDLLPLCVRRQQAALTHVKPLPSPDDLVDAVQLCRRLQSMQRALEDIPGQAQRLARRMARRVTAPPGPKRLPPLRPLRPPGYRKRPIHEIDKILDNCHGLALYAPTAPDTS